MNICSGALKKCNNCKNIYASTTEFFNKRNNVPSGLSARCKSCTNKTKYKWRNENREAYLAIRKKYHAKNKQQENNRCAQYRKNNLDREIERQKKYREENKEKRSQYTNKWREKNKTRHLAKAVEYKRRRLNTDAEFRMMHRLRGRLRMALNGSKKSEKTNNLIGCSSSFLFKYIQSKFADGMSWDNYGRGGWSLDHIIPCAAFDMTDPKQQLQCFHYSNLQPLWERDNIKKRDKLSSGVLARNVSKVKT